MIAKLEGIGVKKERILHTAESIFHDHKLANAARAEVLLDLPATRPKGFWGHHESGRDAPRRLQVQQHA
jgi:hypothetical protein